MSYLKTEKFSVVAYSEGNYLERTDTLAVEALLTVIVNGNPRFYCMRTPGMDTELAAGLCFNDSLITSGPDIIDIIQESDSVVRMNIPGVVKGGSDEIKIIRSSSGVIAGNSDSTYDKNQDDFIRITADELFAMQNDFFTHQKIYSETGATHAAGIYNAERKLLVYAEDVGRHNALDKCIGSLLLSGEMDGAVFGLLSSRLSYEMVLKAARAGLQVVAGVSAPTAFAVKLARSRGITLAGYLRSGRFNVYSGEWRFNMENTSAV